MSSVREHRILTLFSRLQKQGQRSFLVEIKKGKIHIVYNDRKYVVEIVKRDNKLFWRLTPYNNSNYLIRVNNDPDFMLVMDVIEQDITFSNR